MFKSRRNSSKPKKSKDIYDGPAFKIARFLFKILCVVAPKLAAGFAAKIFSRPRRFRRPLRELKVLQSAQAFCVHTKRGKIAAWQWGAGPVILCIHGWEGRGTQFHEYVRPLVDAGFRVVVFDGPAHGDSDGTYTNLIHFVEDVRELVKIVGPLHGLIAHSFGGAAATLLLKSGLHVERAVYFAVPNNMIEITENFGSILGLTPRVLHNMRDDFLRQHAGEWKAYASSWEELEMAKIAKSFSTPLLIVHDKRDRQVKIHNSEAISRAWQGAQLLQTDGLGHQRIMRDPQVLARVLEFFKPVAEPVTVVK